MQNSFAVLRVLERVVGKLNLALLRPLSIRSQLWNGLHWWFRRLFCVLQHSFHGRHLALQFGRHPNAPLTHEGQVEDLRYCQAHIAAQRLCIIERTIALISFLSCAKPLQLTIAKHEEAECDGGRVEDADELEPEGKRANGGQTEIPGGRVQVLVPVELLDQNVLRI